MAKMAAEVRVTLDLRERALIDLMRGLAPPVAFEIRNLEVGDALVEAGGNTLVLERKTIADLAASIKDGRYAEQKQRLRALTSGRCDCRVLVVLETPLSYDDERRPTAGVRNSALVSAALGTELRDGIAVLRTDSLKETAHLIRALARRMGKDPGRFFRDDTAATDDDDYRPNVTKTCRRDNLDPATAFRMQLCTVPLISLKTADAIIDAMALGSAAALLRELERPGGLKTLVAVPGVGATIAANVALYFGAKVHEVDVGDVGRYFMRVPAA
jgi:ERCC4-type nuclease